MRLEERYDLEKIRNRRAETVYRKVEEILETHAGFCRCEECVLDLVAYVLNRVTPDYATSLLEPLHPSREKTMKKSVEIDLALEAGMKKIIKHPHHEDAGAVRTTRERR
jgi:competence protein ComFB